MQLFRQQALDHQNRLHGEVFLVPPLRWHAILWLLAGATCLALLFVNFGTYNRTLTIHGTLRQADGGWMIHLDMPPEFLPEIRQGQDVRATIADERMTGLGSLSGAVDDIARAPGTTKPHLTPVSVRLAPLSKQQREKGLALRPGLKLDAHIVVDRQTVLQWLTRQARKGWSG